jgi:UDP-glucose 4-epimerase
LIKIRKRIFISGVAGFLGSHLAEELINEGHEVLGCDNLIGGYLDNVPSKVEFYQEDCTDLDAMVKITKNSDIIYHCAAAAYEGLSVFSPNFVTKNIFQSTTSILSAAIQNNVKRFVFTSSMARYGDNEAPFREFMIPKPKDPYGIAKYSSELILKNLSDIHGMEYVIAVPHNIIGPRQKYDDPYRNVASIFINRMLQGKQPIIYGDGNQKRCFSFVQDCVSCLKKMGFDKNAVGEIINIGPDEGVITINDLAKEIAELLDFKLNPIYFPLRPQDINFAICSSDKARKLLNYKTTYTLERGLSEMIGYIKRNGPKPFRYHLDLEIINKRTPKTWKEHII